MAASTSDTGPADAGSADAGSIEAGSADAGSAPVAPPADDVRRSAGPAGPVLFCFDGSVGSHSAMAAAAELVSHPMSAVVLTVWQPAFARLAQAGAFAAMALSNEAEVDDEEARSASSAAEEGARVARDMGYDASALTREATEGVGHTILEVAEELDARLIVCGQRGRGAIRTTLLGSVSHLLSAHTRRPVLIAPEGSDRR